MENIDREVILPVEEMEQQDWMSKELEKMLEEHLNGLE